MRVSCFLINTGVNYSSNDDVQLVQAPHGRHCQHKQMFSLQTFTVHVGVIRPHQCLQSMLVDQTTSMFTVHVGDQTISLFQVFSQALVNGFYLDLCQSPGFLSQYYDSAAERSSSATAVHDWVKGRAGGPERPRNSPAVSQRLQQDQFPSVAAPYMSG